MREWGRAINIECKEIDKYKRVENNSRDVWESLNHISISIP